MDPGFVAPSLPPDVAEELERELQQLVDAFGEGAALIFERHGLVLVQLTANNCFDFAGVASGTEAA